MFPSEVTADSTPYPQYFFHSARESAWRRYGITYMKDVVDQVRDVVKPCSVWFGWLYMVKVAFQRPCCDCEWKMKCGNLRTRENSPHFPFWEAI